VQGRKIRRDRATNPLTADLVQLVGERMRKLEVGFAAAQLQEEKSELEDLARLLQALAFQRFDSGGEGGIIWFTRYRVRTFLRAFSGHGLLFAREMREVRGLSQVFASCQCAGRWECVGGKERRFPGMGRGREIAEENERTIARCGCAVEVPVGGTVVCAEHAHRPVEPFEKKREVSTRR